MNVLRKPQAAVILGCACAVADARKQKAAHHLWQNLSVDTITFDNPMNNGKLVDWCLTFQADCGKPAADAYCQMRGYGDAIIHPKRQVYHQETLTMEQPSICSPSRNIICNSFDYITCRVLEHTFEYPMEHDRALDACLSYSRSCGIPAANAYCKDMGYVMASEYFIIESRGETMAHGDHSVCDPNWHPCNTFTSITCLVSA